MQDGSCQPFSADRSDRRRRLVGRSVCAVLRERLRRPTPARTDEDACDHGNTASRSSSSSSKLTRRPVARCSDGRNLIGRESGSRRSNGLTTEWSIRLDVPATTYRVAPKNVSHSRITSKSYYIVIRFLYSKVRCQASTIILPLVLSSLCVTYFVTIITVRDPQGGDTGKIRKIWSYLPLTRFCLCKLWFLFLNCLQYVNSCKKLFSRFSNYQLTMLQ